MRDILEGSTIWEQQIKLPTSRISISKRHLFSGVYFLLKGDTGAVYLDVAIPVLRTIGEPF